MLRRIVNIVVFVPIAILLVVLSVANRHEVRLALNPFDPSDATLSISGPLFAFLFLAVIVGIVIGGAVTWMEQGKHRRQARVEAREAIKWHGIAEKRASVTQPAADIPAGRPVSPAAQQISPTTPQQALPASSAR
ncbi:DUF1049 domain-containing protein [Xaviernesmea oryzae]|uniref:DUF1049 domain-containing protein n=1 Tax=Xaviernesmea oryzae TaxID=464029 RepID=A0A1Q9AV45_9HYPH|nr:DUF1049 domain-containing protein [Xaviernesmea oryzae]SEK80661.1 hypothetical protein SAMN04487976_10469 [Xaviernesmea oryzae]